MEWIFSGIGVALLILMVDLIKNYVKNNKIKSRINRIADKYVDILDNKIRGHSGIVGLIECGAANLSKNKHLLKVCDLIIEQGKPNPLNWLLEQLDEKEALNFIKWQANNEISRTYYFNKNNFKKLIERYKQENRLFQPNFGINN